MTLKDDLEKKLDALKIYHEEINRNVDLHSLNPINRSFCRGRTKMSSVYFVAPKKRIEDVPGLNELLDKIYGSVEGMADESVHNPYGDKGDICEVGYIHLYKPFFRGVVKQKLKKLNSVKGYKDIVEEEARKLEKKEKITLVERATLFLFPNKDVLDYVSKRAGRASLKYTADQGFITIKKDFLTKSREEIRDMKKQLKRKDLSY